MHSRCSFLEGQGILRPACPEDRKCIPQWQSLVCKLRWTSHGAGTLVTGRYLSLTSVKPHCFWKLTWQCMFYLCVLDSGSHELGRQSDLPETNPVNKADSRASQMRAVMSASRTLASPSTYGQPDSAEHPSAGQGGQPSPRTQLTPGSPPPPSCLLRLHDTAPEMGDLLSITEPTTQ